MTRQSNWRFVLTLLCIVVAFEVYKYAIEVELGTKIYENISFYSRKFLAPEPVRRPEEIDVCRLIRYWDERTNKSAVDSTVVIDKPDDTERKGTPSPRCGLVQPQLSYVLNNTVVLNASEVARIESERGSKLVCEYTEYFRSPAAFETIKDGDSKMISVGESISPQGEYVKLSCSTKSDPAIPIYLNLHATYSTAWKQAAPQDVTATDRFSVLLLLVEGTSPVSFMRDYPKTLRYIEKSLDFKSMRGYSRLSEYSFHNLLPILTGRSLAELTLFKMVASASIKPEPDLAGALQIDPWPFIWRQFMTNGYYTSLNELSTDNDLLNFPLLKFNEAQTDHNFRPFWSSLDANPVPISPQAKYNAEVCYGNEAKAKIQLDLLKRMFQKYEKKRLFAFAMLPKLYSIHSFDYKSTKQLDAAETDAALQRFFSEMFQAGHLDSTIALFASDIGRTKPLPAKSAGQKTDTLTVNSPFLFVRLPSKFTSWFPDAAAALERNRERLSTPFDLFATMEDIATSNFKGVQRPAPSRALSLLADFHASRDCKQANVPKEFCPCE